MWKIREICASAHCSRFRDEVRAPIIASLFLKSARPRSFCIGGMEKGKMEGDLKELSDNISFDRQKVILVKLPTLEDRDLNS